MRRALILPPKSVASTVTDPTSWPWRLRTFTVKVPVTSSVCGEAIAVVPSCGRTRRGQGPLVPRALSPSRPASCRAPGSAALTHHADLDVHTRRQAESFVQSLDRLHRRLQDVDQPLMRADLKLLARLPVDVRRPQHRVPFDPRRQRDRAVHFGPGSLRGVHDFQGGAVQRLVVVTFHADADALALHAGSE